MSHTMLYRAPGAHDIHGGKFDYMVVPDALISEAQADGWFLTTPEAQAAYDASRSGEANAPADNAAPSRAELEQKAGELGIVFDKRLGDKKLAALIEAKLKG